MEDELLTTCEVATLVNCSVSTVRRWSAPTWRGITPAWRGITPGDKYLICTWWKGERPPGWAVGFRGRTYTRAEARRWAEFRSVLAAERNAREEGRAERKRRRLARCGCCTLRQARHGCLTKRAKRLQEHILAQPQEVRRRWEEHGWLTR